MAIICGGVMSHSHVSIYSFIVYSWFFLCQGMFTAGGCRYRQAIPLGKRGRQDINSNHGLRKAFLPQVANLNYQSLFAFADFSVAQYSI